MVKGHDPNKLRFIRIYLTVLLVILLFIFSIISFHLYKVVFLDQTSLDSEEKNSELQKDNHSSETGIHMDPEPDAKPKQDEQQTTDTQQPDPGSSDHSSNHQDITVPRPYLQWLATSESGDLDDIIQEIHAYDDYIYLLGNTEADLNIKGRYRISNDGDNDFFVLKYNTSGEPVLLLTSEARSGDMEDWVSDIYVLENGTMYIAGYSQSRIDFGNKKVMNNSGGFDFFIARYTEDKPDLLITAKTSSSDASADDDDFVYDIFVDNQGSIYAAGETKGVLDFGRTKRIRPDNKNFFLVRYNSKGDARLLIAPEKSEGDVNLVNMHIADNSYIYVTGYTDGDVDFGNGKKLINTGKSDFFIVQYTSRGSVKWIATASGIGHDMPIDVYYDSTGIYLIGKTTADLDFGNDFTLENHGGYDFFVVKYDYSGSPVMLLTSEKGSASEEPVQLIISSPYLYLLGWTEGNVDFGNNVSLVNKGFKDFFIVRYSFSGTPDMLISPEKGAKDDIPVKFNVDISNNIYLLGHSKSNLDLGNNVKLDNRGRFDFFLAAYNAIGSPQWLLTNRYFSGTKEDFLDGLELEDSGKKDDYAVDFLMVNSSIYIAGMTEGDLDFGHNNYFTNNGEKDFFLLKYS